MACSHTHGRDLTAGLNRSQCIRTAAVQTQTDFAYRTATQTHTQDGCWTPLYGHWTCTWQIILSIITISITINAIDHLPMPMLPHSANKLTPDATITLSLSYGVWLASAALPLTSWCGALYSTAVLPLIIMQQSNCCCIPSEFILTFQYGERFDTAVTLRPLPVLSLSSWLLPSRTNLPIQQWLTASSLFEHDDQSIPAFATVSSLSSCNNQLL